MFFEFRPVKLLRCGLCAAVIFGAVGGCGPEQYKADADKEVYKIIDGKWQGRFGGRSNYRIDEKPSLVNEVQLKKVVRTSGVISLAQAVAMATADNRKYQREKEELYKSALSLTGERHKYALQWFGSIDGSYVNDGEEKEVSFDARLRAEQASLLPNGVIMSTALAIDWIRFLTGAPRTTVGSVLTGSLTVPLLGIGAGKVAWEELTQAERDVLYRIRSFNRYRKTFVVDIVNAYYGVLQKRDAAGNAENNYKRVVESEKRLAMEVKAGRRSRIDVDEAKQKVLSAEDKLVGARESYKQALNLFKIRLALPIDTEVELDQNELNALEEMGVSEVDYTLDTAIETGLVQRLDLATSADRIDDALRNVVLAADGLGPQLNLTGKMDVSSRETTDFKRLEFHKGTYELGFDADLPFDRKAQRNSYRRALITLQQRQRQYEDDTENIKLDVREAYRQLRKTADQYEIQKNSLELAEQRVENNKLLLDAGRVEVRALLESQDSLFDAQNNVTAALVNHLNAKLSFFRDIGILQVRPDGMWEEQTL